MASDGYYRTGRGGAGNFRSQTEVLKAETDVEAQPASRDAAPDPAEQKLADYAHLGRGGAGNWYVPAEETPAKKLASAAPKQAPKAPNYSGRGGAGNFMGGHDAAAEEEKRREEKRVLDEEIARDVDMTLQPPKPAHVHSQRSDRSEV